MSTSRSRSRSRGRERRARSKSPSKSKSKDKRRSRSCDRNTKHVVDARRDDIEADEGVSLLCRNLGYNTDKHAVRKAFEEFGKVLDVYMPIDYMTKQPRGFAFVEMGDRRAAQGAMEGLDNKNVDGRAVKVLFAQQKRKRPEQMQTLDPRTARGAHFDPRRVEQRGRDQRNGGHFDQRGPGGPSRGRDQGRDCRRSRSRSRRRRRRSPSRSRSRRRD